MTISFDEVLQRTTATASVLKQNHAYLTELDSAIADADHGANIELGFKAVMSKMPELAHKDIGTLFKTVGMTSAGKKELNLEDWTNALEAALDGAVMRGKAQLEDKTMVDALALAVNDLKSAVIGNTPFSKAPNDSAEAAWLQYL